MTLRDLPNVLSILRIFMVLPVVWALVTERYQLALTLFFVAGASDGLDGFLAKRFHWTSRLGSILDPAADKLLLVSSYVALGWLGHIPLWLVWAVVARDLIIVGGALAYYVLFGGYEMRPHWASKLNTVMQIVLGLAVVTSLALWALPQPLLDGLIYVVLVTSVLSGVEYVWVWSGRARSAWRLRRSQGNGGESGGVSRRQ